MTRIFRLVLIMAFLIIAVNDIAWAKENPFAPKVPSKTGMVEYDVKGSATGEGFEKIYWRTNGTELVKITKTSGKMMGLYPVSSNIRVITTPEWIITIDNEKKKGTKIVNPRKYMVEDYQKLSSKEKAIVRKNIEKLGFSMAAQTGAELKKKAGKHLGYTCDITTVMGSTIYNLSAYPTIMMKQEASIMGLTSITEATKLEKNASIPDSLFKVGDGITLTRNRPLDDKNKEFARGIINMMKDPNAAQKMEQGMKGSKTQATPGWQHKAPSLQTPKERKVQKERRSDQVIVEEAEEKKTETTKPAEDEKVAKEKMDETIQQGLKTLKGLFKKGY